MDFNDKLFDFLVATDQLDDFLGKNNKKDEDTEEKIETGKLQEENNYNIKENEDEKEKDFSDKK